MCLALFGLLPLLAIAADTHHHGQHNHEHDAEFDGEYLVDGIEDAACDAVIEVSVNGMVCDFCARALEKVVGKREEVSGIEVDLDEARVSIALQPGAITSDATVTRLVTDSGYDVVAIERGC